MACSCAVKNFLLVVSMLCVSRESIEHHTPCKVSAIFPAGEINYVMRKFLLAMFMLCVSHEGVERHIPCKVSAIFPAGEIITL